MAIFRRAVVFHNPGAGTGPTPLAWVRRQLEAAGIDAEVYSVPAAPGKIAPLRLAPDLVIIIGGNGTVRHALLHLPDHSAPVLLIPAGTANNIARSLGVSELPKAINLLDQVSMLPFDLGTVEWKGDSHHFLESAGAGIIARMMHLMQLRKANHPDAQQYQTEKYQDAVYLMWEIARTQSAHPYRLLLDGQDYSGDFLFVEVMNISLMGPGLRLAPAADPGDGLLDVTLLRPEARPQFERYLEGRLQGRPAPPTFETHRCRTVELEWTAPDVHIDGETFKEYDDRVMRLSVLPNDLQFLAPVGAGRDGRR